MAQGYLRAFYETDSGYYSRQGYLHGECFYNGLCDSLEFTKNRIRRTSRYIDDAQSLTEEALYKSGCQRA